jgi:hypothetical protein
MKAITSAFAIVSSLALTSASPIPGTGGAHIGRADFMGIQPDGALNRWSYSFSGVSEDNFGQDFLSAFRKFGGITHNWQAWKDEDAGYWRFDVSETVTFFGDRAVVFGVEEVTGRPCIEQGVPNNICAVLHS